MSATIDEQFIEYIVKSLVGNPDAVEIKRTIDEKGVLLELTVDPQDLGRVIGKRGSGAQALRTLLRALGTKNDARYNLKIVDNGEPRPARDQDETKVADDEPKISEATTDEPVDTPAEEAEEPERVPQDEEKKTSSSLTDKTRAELADLDDLDIQVKR